MKVKPAKEGMIIRDPRTHNPIPNDGCDVPNDSFWRRRINDGDVVEITETKKETTKKAAAATANEAKGAD